MSPEVDQTLCVRLDNTECDIKLSNGKLMERLLTFKVSINLLLSVLVNHVQMVTDLSTLRKCRFLENYRSK